MKPVRSIIAAALVSLALQSAAVAAISQAKVERSADTLRLTWADDHPVDIYERTAAAPRLLKKGARQGAFTLEHADRTRRYFVLVDEVDHQRLTVAERLVPLAQGSNFRDIGGYPAAGGKHVRWGLIYRSGAQPMLSPEDLAQLRTLGLAQLVDLRSSEERWRNVRQRLESRGGRDDRRSTRAAPKPLTRRQTILSGYWRPSGGWHMS